MIIMGVDPGFALVGWGVVDSCNSDFIIGDYGCLRTEAKVDFCLRLETIYKGLQELFQKYRPEVFVLEELFFNSNAKTVIQVGQARGVIILAAQHFGIPIFEYTPLQVKVAVTGYGRANKTQIQRMVQHIFKLKEIPQPDDAADALAVAYCHSVNVRIE